MIKIEKLEGIDEPCSLCTEDTSTEVRFVTKNGTTTVTVALCEDCFEELYLKLQKEFRRRLGIK